MVNKVKSTMHTQSLTCLIGCNQSNPCCDHVVIHVGWLGKEKERGLESNERGLLCCGVGERWKVCVCVLELIVDWIF